MMEVSSEREMNPLVCFLPPAEIWDEGVKMCHQK